MDEIAKGNIVSSSSPSSSAHSLNPFVPSSFPPPSLITVCNGEHDPPLIVVHCHILSSYLDPSLAAVIPPSPPPTRIRLISTRITAFFHPNTHPQHTPPLRLITTSKTFFCICAWSLAQSLPRLPRPSICLQVGNK